MSALLSALCGLCAIGPGTVHGHTPVSVIFDTDMSADIDDAMALGLLHALQDRGEANLLAITISTDDRYLKLDETQVARTQEAMVSLASQPPVEQRRDHP